MKVKGEKERNSRTSLNIHRVTLGILSVFNINMGIGACQLAMCIVSGWLRPHYKVELAFGPPFKQICMGFISLVKVPSLLDHKGFLGILIPLFHSNSRTSHGI